MTQMIKSLSSCVRSKMSAFIADEEGATAAEYGLIAALIAVAIIGVVKLLGGKLQSTFNNISTNLPSGNPGG